MASELTAGKITAEDATAATLTVRSTGANANPRLIIDAGGGSGTADPHIKFDSDGVDWSVGVDQDDSDSFKIAKSSGLGTPKLTIDSAGLATFANGINLGNVASATATTLDGYKEGTFTVTYGGTTASAVTNSTGIYVRIGGLVWFSYYNNGATFASSSAGATLLGLPYTCANSSDSNYTAFTYQYGNAVDGNSRGGYIGRNGTTMYFMDDGATSAATYVDGSGQKIMVSGCYQTNDAF